MARKLPADDPTHGLDRGGTRGGGGVVTQHDDPDRVRVEPSCVGTDRGPVEAPGSPLPHPAETVDDEVVADVGPTPSIDVVRLDSADHAGNLGLAVGVGADRVVNDGQVDRRAVADGFDRPGTPGCTGGDVERAGHRRFGDRGRFGHDPALLLTYQRHLGTLRVGSVHVQLVADRVSHPDRFGGGDRAGSRCFSAVRIGALVQLHTQLTPVAPAPIGRERPDHHRGCWRAVEQDPHRRELLDSRCGVEDPPLVELVAVQGLGASDSGSLDRQPFQDRN